jgi:N-acetyl-anhydromuramyl-L-alanine amidase AmpD
MHYRRRSLLKLGGTAVFGTTALDRAVTDTQAAPAVEWNPAARSNYSDANRTTADIDWIILHTIQGSYQAGINTFKKPSEDVSAHYVVGREPGQFTKMVRTRDVAWTAGNAGYNRRGLNIEMAGFSDSGFSDQMYENMAELVEFLCESYDVPKRIPDVRVAPCDPAAGAGGIIGHVHVPDPTNCRARGGAGRHTDPGPYFDYERLVDAITGDPEPAFGIGETVRATRDLNVRAEPEIDFNVVHTFPAGATGTITDGYRIADNYLWWRIDWQDDVTGWAIQQYLAGGSDDGDDDTGGRDDPRDGGDEGDGDDDSGGEDDSGDDRVGAAPRFEIGQQVAATTGLNTRDEPTLTAAVRQTVSTDTIGRITDGIVTADGYTWWQIEWETGTSGWSVQTYLTEGDTETGSDGTDENGDTGEDGRDDRTEGSDEDTGGDRSEDSEDSEDSEKSTTRFQIGERVTPMVRLNTRRGPTLEQSVRETISPGTVGWITDGIVTADGYTWWQIEWETGTTGWSVEVYLDESSHWTLFGE